MASLGEFETLKVFRDPQHSGVAQLVLNRPSKSNAFNGTAWREFPRAVALLGQPELGVRAVVVSGEGKNFCAGIDVEFLSSMFASFSESGPACLGRKTTRLRQWILEMQESFNSLERCPVPVVAAVHGSCVGAGVDLVSACDVATCSADACFCVKEVDLAIAADMGSLQRLPGLIGAGRTAELALTARTFHGPEAAAMGLVAQCAAHGGRDAALQSATAIATAIASKSPVAVMATKRVLLHKRDHSVSDSLEYVATLNSSLLLSADMAEAATARAERRPPLFSKL